MKIRTVAGLGGAALAVCLWGAAAQADTITKLPDLGPFYAPLSTSSTFVYADSFVAPSSGAVSSIGIWFQNGGGDTSAQPVAFEVLGSAGGGGPDASDILATTGVLTLDVAGGLSLYSASTISSLDLVAGETYWVAGDERGLSGGGDLQVGGHTQNSGGIVDDGTFWYSNDPTGSNFDGQSLTPEMAFTVTVGASSVPEASTWVMMLAGFAGIGLAGYRSSRNSVPFAA